MADNYLEKKMEEYRRGNSAGNYTRRMTPNGPKAGHILMTFPSRRVLVIAEDVPSYDIAMGIVRSLCTTGCRVAFTGNDFSEGQKAAQSTGGQFHKVPNGNLTALDNAMAYITEKWGSVEILISCGAENAFNHASASHFLDSGCVRIIVGENITPSSGAISVELLADTPVDAVTRLILYLALPDSAMLCGYKIKVSPDGTPELTAI